MTSPRPKLFDLAPLAHPVWWAALVVLVINDNLLKGGGVVPAVITGKLSDFAFLIVAPVVLAALLPRAVPGRRLFALIAVAGLYTAADLSRTVSDAIVAAAARFGLAWRLWPDVTDLVALIVLPIPIRLLYQAGGGSQTWFRLLRERAAVILGAAACIATSDDSISDRPFLFNATAGAETIRVTWVLNKLQNSSCDAPEALAATLNPNDLDDPRELLLERGQVAVLGGPTPAGESPIGTCTASSIANYSECVAAIVEAPAAAPVLMIAPMSFIQGGASGFGPDCGGSDAPPLKRCAPMLNPAVDAGPGALTLSEAGGQRRFVAGKEIKIVAIDPAAVAARAPAPSGCRALRDEYRTLIMSTSCAADADCTVRHRSPTLDESSACSVFLNASVAQPVDDILRDWSTGCFSTAGYHCALQPAVCRNGTCQAVCPDVTVPECPDLQCADDPQPGGCLSEYRCRRGEDFCSCVDDKLSCGPPQPAAPGCPLACLNRPDGAVWVDGGARD